MEPIDRENIILYITELKEQITDFQQQKIAAETTLRSLHERLANTLCQDRCRLSLRLFV